MLRSVGDTGNHHDSRSPDAERRRDSGAAETSGAPPDARGEYARRTEQLMSFLAFESPCGKFPKWTQTSLQMQ